MKQFVKNAIRAMQQHKPGYYWMKPAPKVRVAGYYWVMFEGYRMPAFFDGYYWLITGHETYFDNSDFEQIDPFQITHG